MKKQIALAIAACGLTLGVNLMANEISQQEMSAYTAMKYNVDFNAQTEKGKHDLVAEYQQTALLANHILQTEFKNDLEFNVAARNLAVGMWSQKFMKNAQVDDKKLKELYEKEEPKTVPTYKLLNILVKNANEADKIVKIVSEIKESNKKILKFKELVKSESQDFMTRSSVDNVNWIEINKLDPNIQTLIKDKKADDVFKAEVANVGTQILYIEEYKPQRKVSFEESKEWLISLAKQELLKQEIQKIVGAGK